MKHMTIFGVAIGLLFALAVIIGGFTGFLWALFFGVIGGIIGAQLDGRIDVRVIFDNLTSGRGGRG